jgi:hypothetical protein
VSLSLEQFSTSDYSLQLAHKCVDDYSGKSDAMTKQLEAVELQQLDDFLRSGIEAHNWLRRAQEVLQEAARAGLSVSNDAKEALDFLYRQWLGPCPHAERRIEQQEKAGHPVAAAEEFRQACQNVRNRVYAMEMHEALEDAFEGRMFDDAFWTEAGKYLS